MALPICLLAALCGQSEGSLIINNSINRLDQSVQEQTRVLKEQEDARKLREMIQSFEPNHPPENTGTQPKPSPWPDDWFQIPPPRPKPPTVVVQPSSVDLAPLYVLAGALVVAVGMACGTILLLRPRPAPSLPQPEEPSKNPGGFEEPSPVELSPLAVVMIGVAVCGSVVALLTAFVSTYGP